MLNIATFNIYWYPASYVAQNQRNAEDEQRIARVLTNLASHVIVFQEILNLERLQQLLEQVGTNLRLTDPSGSSLPSDNGGSMKIACAYDADLLDLVDEDTLDDPDPEREFSRRRLPYAVHLRHRETGWEFTLVGVHFKSGMPDGGDPEADLRSLEVEYLAGWLAAEPGSGSGHFAAPPTPDVLVMGDFNLVTENEILLPLRTGTLGSWHWSEPEVVTSLVGGEPGPPLEEPDERWTTFLDKMVIDHALMSPGVEARRVGSPYIYAFDLDPEMDDLPSPEGHWLRQRTSYRVQLSSAWGPQVVENLYRISDHRPLRVSLDPG